MNDFTAETGIAVDLVAPGTEYETVMKTRMASNDLPDVFETHGWSVLRYSEYLKTLNDQPWYDRVSDAALGVIADADKNIYVLPLSLSISGLIYNADTLAEAGVDPLSINSLDDFYAACEKVKAIGKIPIYIGGKESGNPAGFLGSIMPAMLTDVGAATPSGEALKNGTFDWDGVGTTVMQAIADMIKKGYVNEDITTADSQMMQTAVGTGDAAFVFRASTNITMARNYVPDCNVQFMPIPSATGEGLTFKVGEGCCLGIWKDTKNSEAAEKFLEFMSRPENAERARALQGYAPAMIDDEVVGDYTIEQYTKAQEEFAGRVYYDNVFDREYFPNGMWGIMGESVIMVAMDTSEAGVAAAVENLKTNYLEKYEAAQN